MDLPEVIDLRRDLLPEPAGDHYIAGSLLETQWMDDLRKKHPEGEFIIVIEGVLMYFYESRYGNYSPDWPTDSVVAKYGSMYAGL